MQTATASSTPSQPPRELMVGEPGSPVGASADPRFAQYKIIRRNGSVVGFEPAKITIAMTKARMAPPPENVEATRKGQRGPTPAVRRPCPDAPKTTSKKAAMTSIRLLHDIPTLVSDGRWIGAGCALISA